MNTRYEIYNASAGSGKTFTLAVKYLEKLLDSSENESFKSILALTFTNKACEEMKERILSSLKTFSEPDILNNSNEMFCLLKKNLGLSSKELHQRSKTRLELILHNYSFFQVSTIDSFNHGIIKSFAKELNLATDLDVVLNSETIINKSIEILINSLNKKEPMGKSVVDFANLKMADGKSWDISYDIKELSSLLTNERYYEKTKKLEKKDVNWFIALKTELFSKREIIESEISKEVKKCEKIISKINNEIKFNRNLFPNFVKRAANKDFKKIDLEKGKNLFLKNKIFNNTHSLEKGRLAKIIDSFFSSFQVIEKNINEWRAINAFTYSIIPMSVLSTLRRVIKRVQLERKEILISDFNTIINEEIKNQPAPYIFEKIGNRIKHYLIDEFQDTSTIQWVNLIPLISHSLESMELDGTFGSLTILGDPKQSLYRWRGANPENFSSIIEGDTPFSIHGKTFNLPKNYRSFDQVIKFNNKFFNYVSTSLKFKENKNIYSLSSQNQNQKKGGYVSIEFLRKEDIISSPNNLFLQKCLAIIKNNIDNKANFQDFCILVRNKNQLNMVTEFLILNEIPVISSESLLLASSFKVKILLEAIRLRIDPNNKIARRIILENVTKSNQKDEIFRIFEKRTSEHVNLFFEKVFNLDYQVFVNLDLFDALKQLIRTNQAQISYDAYVQFFMDEVFGFFSRKMGDEEDFLNYFEENKENLNISTCDINAISILTIHKSKGLEFPIVIYPFADSRPNISNKKKIWLPYKLNGKLIELMVADNKDLYKCGEYAEKYLKKLKKEEELDNVNLLYVAFTRAIEQLYVISTYTEKDSFESHNEIIMSFVENCGFKFEGNLSFSWGKFQNNHKLNKKEVKLGIFKHRFLFQNHPPVVEKKYDDSKTSFGKSFHNLMSRINYSFQFEKELQAFLSNKSLSEITANRLIDISKKILDNKKLKKYFSKEYEVINEKEIFVEGKEILVPDRLVKSKQGKYTIIEYKTGKKRTLDNNQVVKYKNALEEMDLKLEKTLLVYYDDLIEVIEV